MFDQRGMLLLNLIGVIEEHQIGQAQVIDSVLHPKNKRIKLDSSQHAVVLVKVAEDRYKL